MPQNYLLSFTALFTLFLHEGADFMPNIRPISDLRNYSEVLRDVTVGAPVFLTKNGQGRYVILDIQDYEAMQSSLVDGVTGKCNIEQSYKEKLLEGMHTPIEECLSENEVQW